MGLNRKLIGQSRTSDDILVVTEDKIREAVAQFDEPLDAYLDPAAARKLGYPDIIAPPAFACRLWFRMVWGWPVNEPELGRKPGVNMLLSEQRTRHHRPIVCGDRLALTATVLDIKRILMNRDMIAVESQIATADGEPVCVTEHRLVVSVADTVGED